MFIFSQDIIKVHRGRTLGRSGMESLSVDTLDATSLDEVETGRWILAIAKHLDAFAVSQPQLTFLYATRLSAKDGLLLLRLRGLGTIYRAKVQALALDVGIPRQEVVSVLTRIEAITELISVHGSSSSADFDYVIETVLTEHEIYRAVAKLFNAADPHPVERIIAPLLDLMSRLPLTEEEVITRCCQQGFTEENVRKALQLQEAFRLLSRQRVADLGITLLYNEYLWGRKIERIGPLLAGLGRRETEDVLALMEEVRSGQGQSVDLLTSAPPHIVALAAQAGIIDTTTIITANQDEKTFAFSPHFYGYRAGPQPQLIEDASDQVKLFVASIAYGVQHSSDFRLHSPMQFVQRLYDEGEAGLATPILRDYILLERQGIVSVEERARGRGTFVLLKPDVVERALDVMRNGSLLGDRNGTNDGREIISQQSVRSPEMNRLVAGFGETAGETRQFDEELFASIRETAQRRDW